MSSGRRPVWYGSLALVSLLAVSACGGSSRSSSASSSGSSTSTRASTAAGAITVVEGRGPGSLDPGAGNTRQAAEADWIAYTGLTTYAHQSSTAGTQVIPGLATALPTVSDGGRTYTVTLRKGLVYSNGTPVRASDFPYSIERAMKIPWGGSGQFYGGTIAGAAAYAQGSAKAISGISADDATGQITIHLLRPYGAFENVLALPSSGLVPAGTPMRNLPENPPPGVGPYMISNVVVNRSFSLVRNPQWASMNIPGIPAGNSNLNVRISSNAGANALSVLQNSADVFDWTDTIPGRLLRQIQSQAPGRFSEQVVNATYYFFLNSRTKPFSSQLARQAVVAGLDRNALTRLGSGTLVPACYFLPPGIVGHPTAPCPYGNPAAGGDLPQARQLVQQSGMAGTPVTVWSEAGSPRRQWASYYTGYLNQLGFKATLSVIAGPRYPRTVGALKLDPQTGLGEGHQDLPNPIDFYRSLQSSDIQPTEDRSLGPVNDRHIDSVAASLGQTPASQASSTAGRWQALDEYVARQAYVATFGYQTVPAFTSNRIDLGAAIFHPVYGWDWATLKLK